MDQGGKSLTTGKTGPTMVLYPLKDRALLHSAKLIVYMFNLANHGKQAVMIIDFVIITM